MYILGGSINGASPKWLLHNGHLINMDDLGVPGYPHFRKLPYVYDIYIYICVCV